MLIWLLERFGPLLDQVTARTTGDSRVFLTGRTAAASVTAFVATLLFGPLVIKWLQRHFRERIASDSATLNELHAGKAETPTMGGVFVMSAVIVSSLLWADLQNSFVQAALLSVVLLTALGACDDWTKQRTERNGLTAKVKLRTQIAMSGVTGFLLYEALKTQPLGTDLIWPLGNFTIPLGVFFIAWVILVMVGTSNAVNLTDGLDGLATGCAIPAVSAYALLTYLCGNRIQAEYLGIPHVLGCGELTIVVGALVGALLGFLWFNCHPAQVFMGDAGSLPIGGLLAVAAVACRQEILLIVIGGIFVAETLSVILQVASFRITGRRVLRCSPLHNHFVFRGDPENRIVARFWIVGAVLAIVGLASLKLR